MIPVSLILFASISFSLAFPNPIYVIRNAETPSLGYEGLTPVGRARAQNCLPHVFGPTSGYGIGKVISCTPNVTTSACYSAVDTATPLAHALNLPVDTSCGSEESNYTLKTCVSDNIATFAATSNKSVLIVWDKDEMDDLFDNFDLENDEPDFPDEWADIIFTVQNNHFTSITSQSCSGIDGTDTGASNSSFALVVPRLEVITDNTPDLNATAPNTTSTGASATITFPPTSSSHVVNPSISMSMPSISIPSISIPSISIPSISIPSISIPSITIPSLSISIPSPTHVFPKRLERAYAKRRLSL